MKKMFLFTGVMAILIALLVSFSNKKINDKEMVNDSPVNKNAIQNQEMNKNRYIEYSRQEFEKNINKKRVYFFHAKWCPTCKVANEEFTENINRIPEDTIVFKTDYDTEKELKTKYGITYQHTFVLVDEQGIELKKWNGGGIDELISNTKVQ